MPQIKSGTRVVITGASSGIGEEIARQLANKGAVLALCARRLEKLEEIKSSLESQGAKVFVYQCDVGVLADVEKTFQAIDKDLGGIDVALLNAGWGKPTPAIADFDAEAFEQIHRVNVLGVVYCLKFVLPIMHRQGSGTIAGVSSLAGYRGLPENTAYCSSKAAVTAMLEGMRVELKPKGINVVVVSPGFVETPLTDKNNFDMPFMWKVDKAAAYIIRGIEKAKREVCFPMPLVATLWMGRGMPNFLWDFLASMVSPKNTKKIEKK